MLNNECETDIETKDQIFDENGNNIYQNQNNEQNETKKYCMASYNNIFMKSIDTLESSNCVNEKEKEKGKTKEKTKEKENLKKLKGKNEKYVDYNKSQMNLMQEDNFLFIPLNEMVQKLKDRDAVIALLKIYEIIIDVFHRYNLILSYLVKCCDNIKDHLFETKNGKKHTDILEEKEISCNIKETPHLKNEKQVRKCENEQTYTNNIEEKSNEEIFCFDKKHFYNLSVDELFLPKNMQLNEIKDSKNFFLTEYFLKSFYLEKCNFSEKCQKIKEKIEIYLKNQNNKYNYFYDFLQFLTETVETFIQSKNTFLKNIYTLIKTIIENIQLKSFNFNYIFGFTVVTILFCFDSFLFHSQDHHFIPDHATVEQNEQSAQNSNEEHLRIKKKYLENQDNVTLLNKEKENSNVIVIEGNKRKEERNKENLKNGITEKKLKIEETIKTEEIMENDFFDFQKKGELNTKEIKKDNSSKTERDIDWIKQGDMNKMKINNLKDYGNSKTMKNIQLKEENKMEQNEEETQKENENDTLLRALKDNIIFEEIEKKMKIYLHTYFYINAKKINDAINKDNWIRIPIKINDNIFNKSFHFSNIISFYKKIFNDFMNKQFLENPLKNLDFRKLEKELCFEKNSSETEPNTKVVIYGKYETYGEIENKNKNENENISSSDDIEETTDIYNEESIDQIKSRGEKNAMENNIKHAQFDIVNFGIILSNTSNTLTNIVQNYFILKELLQNLKTEINEYICKIINFFIFILCLFFMKKEYIEELVIDLRKHWNKTDISDVYFIINKQRKYKHLNESLILYNDHIKKNVEKYNFLHFNKVGLKHDNKLFNTNANLKVDTFCYIKTFTKIYSSASLYALSEKIVAIESFFCFISELTETIKKGTESKTPLKKIDILTKNNEGNKIHNATNKTEKELKPELEPKPESKSESKSESTIFLKFLNMKRAIIDELRLLIYCDSLNEIIESKNYIGDVLKIINEHFGDESTILQDNKKDFNIKKELQKKIEHYIDFYLNILNDAKRKLMFCCEGIISVVIQFMLWNLINYIFNLNNIEIIYKIKESILPVVTIGQNTVNNSGTFVGNTQIYNAYTQAKKIENSDEIIQLNKRHTVFLNKNDKTNFNSNTSSFLKTGNENKGEEKKEEKIKDENTIFLINLLRQNFEKVSNAINDNIKNIEKEIDQHITNNTKIQNAIYAKFYKDLKNPQNKNHIYFFIFLSKNVRVYEQYLNLHYYNSEQISQFVKTYNSNFFQYKHIHSILLKYQHCDEFYEKYAIDFENSILKIIQENIQ